MSLSAQPDNAEDGNRPRFDHAWLKLIVPIGAIVLVAVICLIVAIVTSARRADEMAIKREQQLVQEALVEGGARMLRQLESVAATDRAAQSMRDRYDPHWVDEHLGHWLENFFDHDVVVVVDGADRVRYVRARGAADVRSMPLPSTFATILDFARGRTDTVPAGALPVIASQEGSKVARSAGWIGQVRGHPAIVMAVAVGSESELAAGNRTAPLVLSVKFIDGTLLQKIGDHLQLSGLRPAEDSSAATGLADGLSPLLPTRRATRLPTSPGIRAGRAAKWPAAYCRSSAWPLPVSPCWPAC